MCTIALLWHRLCSGYPLGWAGQAVCPGNQHCGRSSQAVCVPTCTLQHVILPCIDGLTGLVPCKLCCMIHHLAVPARLWVQTTGSCKPSGCTRTPDSCAWSLQSHVRCAGAAPDASSRDPPHWQCQCVLGSRTQSVHQMGTCASWEGQTGQLVQAGCGVVLLVISCVSSGPLCAL